MIPQKLVMQGFGPYRDRQEIDFNKVGTDGIFLMYGDTGAGKSAILDGVTYALYGVSSGGERGRFSDMRCNLCGDGEETFVEFIFQKGGRSYSFRRGISARFKRDGSVVLEETAAAGEMVGGLFRPFSANMKKSDVEAEAGRIIGLNKDQFCQVVILPQGKFEKLLTAGTAEKDELLSTLFGTALWDGAAAELKAMSDAMQKELSVREIALDYILKSNDAKSSEELVEKAEEAVRLFREVEREAEQAAKQKEEACRRERESSLLDDLFCRLDQSIRKQAELKERRRKSAVLEKRLAAARRAKTAESEERLLAEAEKRTQEARVSVLSAQAEQKEAADRMDRAASAAKIAGKKRAEAEELRGRVSVLREKSKSYGELQEALEKLREARRVCGEEQQKTDRAEARQSELKKTLEGLKERLERAKTAADEAEKLEKEAAKGARKAGLQKTLEQIRQSGETARREQRAGEKKLAELEREEKLLAKQYDAAVRAYEKNAALLVASGLHDGEMCPVCGGIYRTAETKQSRKTAPVNPEPKRERLEEVRREIAGLRAGLSAAGERIDGLLKQYEQVDGELTFLGDIPDDVEKRLEEAKAAAAERDGIDRIILDITGELEQVTPGEVQKAAEELAKAQKEVEILEKSAGEFAEDPAKEAKKLAGRAEKLAEEAGAAEGEHLDAATILAAAEAKRQEAEAALERTAADEKRRLAAFLEKIESAGFESREAYGSAKMSEEELTAAETEMDALDDEERQTDLTLAELSARTDGKERPEMETVLRRKREAEEKSDCLAARLAALRERASSLQRGAEEARGIWEEIGAMREQFGEMEGFARLIRGDRGMSIGRYVLGVMLDRVTGEANKLLAGVHGGRYLLVRGRERAKNRKTGLELDIYDSYGAENRHVSTLSGGEKFLVSMALSLGLAAVVRSENGGVAIDAMFIDEGFGTLDESSLGDALDMLAAAGAGGRMIGVISHVDRLRETVGRCLEVKKGRNGSRIFIHI